MNRLSPQLDREVKHKPKDFPALPDSVNPQLEVPGAEPPVKDPQAQDLQKLDPGARDGFALEKDIGVLSAGATSKHTSLAARYILGVITAFLGKAYSKYLPEEWLAQAARTSRWSVIRLTKQLEEAGLLDVERKGKCNRYHVPGWVRREHKIWVNPELVRDDGLSIVAACDLSDLKFRQGKNDAAWPTIQERADVLGVSYHTVARADSSLAALGLIQKRHRFWQQDFKNSYALTCKADEKTGVFRLESARPNWRALGQTIRVERCSYANGVREGISPPDFYLSFDSAQDGAAYNLMRSIGVHWGVARSLAVEWRGRVDSMRQMVRNGLFRCEDYYARMRRSGGRPGRFNLAGYVVKGLNMAKAEGHDIRLSKLALEGQGKGDDQGTGVTAVCHSEAEFAKKREEQKRRLLSAPAKPVTPHSDEELALITSKRDREADAENLRAVQRAVSGRYYIGRKWMNPAQRLDMLVDPCS